MRMLSFMGSSTRTVEKDPDFDDEAQKIFASLGATRSTGRYNSCDPIWKHPTSGGTIFVGNVEAASNLAVLQKNRITHVVNCTDNMPMYHAATGAIVYMQFDIAHWSRQVRSGHDSYFNFTKKLFQFVGDAVSSGNNVLVHCLAGAHRAGTTGCLCLMHFGNLEARQAITLAKRLRPVIDPIGTLPELLYKAEAAHVAAPPRSRFPSKHFE